MSDGPAGFPQTEGDLENMANSAANMMDVSNYKKSAVDPSKGKNSWKTKMDPK